MDGIRSADPVRANTPEGVGFAAAGLVDWFVPLRSCMESAGADPVHAKIPEGVGSAAARPFDWLAPLAHALERSAFWTRRLISQRHRRLG